MPDKSRSRAIPGASASICAEIRRELFDELVADREAFDALPLEEKQKVFAQIEQRMAGVTQGIKVLQKELSSRAVEVRTQDAAAAAVAGALAKAVAATPPRLRRLLRHLPGSRPRSRPCRAHRARCLRRSRRRRRCRRRRR